MCQVPEINLTTIDVVDIVKTSIFKYNICLYY